MNIIHIIKGWFSSQVYSTKAQKKLSTERLEACTSCPYAVDKSFLIILRDEAVEEKTKACNFCGCPIQEKSLVKAEKCPINLWKK